MKLPVLLVAALVLFAADGYARDLPVLPPEMQYEGKQIDPTCVYAALRAKGNGTVLRTFCDEIYKLQGNDDGSPAVQSSLEVGSQGEFGYNYELDGRTGHFFYQYVGKTSEGLILKTSHSSGGTGQFSNLGVYVREGNTLRFIRSIAGGDRCMGGLGDAWLEGGILRYSYSSTLLDLYRKYFPDDKAKLSLGEGPLECAAVVHVIGNKIESVELSESEKGYYPECLRSVFAGHVKSRRLLTANEAKEFIQSAGLSCVQK